MNSNLNLSRSVSEMTGYNIDEVAKLQTFSRRLFDLRWDEKIFGRKPLSWTTAQGWIIAQSGVKRV